MLITVVIFKIVANVVEHLNIHLPITIFYDQNFAIVDYQCLVLDGLSKRFSEQINLKFISVKKNKLYPIRVAPDIFVMYLFMKL